MREALAVFGRSGPGGYASGAAKVKIADVAKVWRVCPVKSVMAERQGKGAKDAKTNHPYFGNVECRRELRVLTGAFSVVSCRLSAGEEVRSLKYKV